MYKKNIITTTTKLDGSSIVEYDYYIDGVMYKTYTEKPKKKYVKYVDYLTSNDWKIIRGNIIKRDNYKCRICSNEENLRVHHLTYQNIFNEKDDDLITLCKECHEKEHIKIEITGLSIEEYYKINKMRKWKN